MTTRKRKHFSRAARYAAVILDLKRGDGRPFIDRDRAKQMTANEIIEEFESLTIDAHVVAHALGGSTHPTNMTIMEKERHDRETRKIDIPAIAKTKRLAKSHTAHQSAMDAKNSVAADASKNDTQKRRQWQSRPMAGTKASGLKKKMDGSVVRR